MENISITNNNQEVKITIPNKNKFLIIPRLVVSGLLSEYNITLEELENSKLIISEAINLVLDNSSQTPLSISFSIKEDNIKENIIELVIIISTSLTDDILQNLSKNGFTIHVLNYLCKKFIIKQYQKTIEINLIKKISLV
jgi:anti-sigma regulatory factor (Ser/Thr protein kinase)